MHILITGGAGFIGSHLANFHLKRGDWVEIIDDLSSGSRANLAAFQSHPRLVFHHADLLDFNGMDHAAARAQRIYHMASIQGRFAILRNLDHATRVDSMGTKRVLEAVVKSGHRPHLVMASSASVYGAAPPGQQHEAAPLFIPDDPLSRHALNKLANEAQGLACAQHYGVPVVIARLFNIVGARQSGLHGAVLPRFVQQALSNSPISVFGNGAQSRSFCDVRDAVAILHTLASCKSAPGRPINVGNTQSTTILELARTVKALTGSSSSIEFVSFEKAYGQSLEPIPQRHPNLDSLQNLTGYRHQWTLQQSVQGICEHYRGIVSRANPAPFQRHSSRPDFTHLPVFKSAASRMPLPS